MNKKIILTVALSALLLLLMLFKKTGKKIVLPQLPIKIKIHMFTEKDFANAMNSLINSGSFKKTTLQWAERIYRMETAHFKSAQYQVCGSPGMESHSDKYPYGWTTMKELNIVPVSSVSIKEGKGVAGDGGIKTKKFLTFNSVIEPLTILCTYIEKYPSPARWYSKDPASQQKYITALQKINVHYV